MRLTQLAILLLALTPPLTAQRAPADIAMVTPTLGTQGTVIALEGSGFGSKKPRVWLTRPGEQKRYPLKVLSFDDRQITARVRRAVEGLLELHVKPRGAPPATAPMPFEIRVPEIQLVEQAAVMKGGSLDIHATFLGNRRIRVHVGGRRARILSRDDVTGHLVVRVRAQPGSQAITIRNRIGKTSWSSGVAVLDASGRLGPPSVRYVLDGSTLASEVTLHEPPVDIAFPGHRFRARTRLGASCRSLVMDVPLDLDQPLPQSWSGNEPIGFEQSRFCCIPLNAPTGGCNASVHVSWLDPALPWRVEILATDGSRLAGAFSGTLLEHSTSLALTEGTFVVDIEP